MHINQIYKNTHLAHSRSGPTISDFLFMCMMLRMREAYKYGTQHGEHISLYKCHQHLKAVHEEQHYSTEKIQAYAVAYAHRPSEEYDTGKAQYHGMPGHHVGKKTDHKRKRLCEYTEQLDNRHHRCRICLKEQRNIRPKNFLPILLVPEEVYRQHRAYGKEKGDVYVACDIGSSRKDGKKPDDISREYEEEHRKEIGRAHV